MIEEEAAVGQLDETTLPVHRLDDNDVKHVADVARSLEAVADGRLDDPAWVAAARDRWEDLPTSLRRAVAAFRRHSGREGALVLSGIPVEPPALPITPAVSGSVQQTATPGAAALVMLACGLGDPGAFLAEKSGMLVQDVVPVRGHEDFQGNLGSVELTFHNENAFHEHRPDFVLLLCLRPDHDRVARLRISCVRNMLSALSGRTKAALAKPEFTTDAPPSFGSGPSTRVIHPVLSGAPDDPDIRVDFAATRALTDDARRALAELGEVVDHSARTAFIQPGDLAIVDNRVALHGRSAFRPRYDGADRWLQRSFAFTDLRRSRSLRADDGYILSNAV